jgi:hypothetical protein
MSYGLPVGAVVNCADNTGAKNLYLISVKRTSRCALENPGARETRPTSRPGDDDDARWRDMRAKSGRVDDASSVA